MVTKQTLGSTFIVELVPQKRVDTHFRVNANDSSAYTLIIGVLLVRAVELLVNRVKIGVDLF